MDVGQRMGKGLGRRIWHSEHDRERDAQLLCAMDMGKAWGVGDDAVGDKGSCFMLGKVIVGSTKTHSVTGLIT